MGTILEAGNISKTYGKGHGQVQALKECSLCFEEGEFVAIIGKSGSGKSTLLKILGSMEEPDGGDILLEGKSILHLKDGELSALRRRKIGFVYQDYNLLPEFTAYENIVMPLHLDGTKEEETFLSELMENLGISYCRDKFPGEMSGGEKQRVAIARALITKPAVIFADEPTGNLDAENSSEVVLLLSKASRIYHQTIIMVTHDMQTAQYADRIIRIKDGRPES